MQDHSDTASRLQLPGTARVSRRRVLGTAAWSAPAIVVATAVPAFAFSGATAVVIGSFTATRAAFVGGTPYYRWASGNGGYTLKTDSPTTIGTNSVLNLALSGITTAGGSGSGTVTIAVTVPSNNTDSNRASAQYGSVSSGWTLAGPPPTINTSTRFVTYTFVSGTAAAGAALPDLNFSVTNSSNSGATTYTWNAGLTVNATSTASDSTAPATTSQATTA